MRKIFKYPAKQHFMHKIVGFKINE